MSQEIARQRRRRQRRKARIAAALALDPHRAGVGAELAALRRFQDAWAGGGR